MNNGSQNQSANNGQQPQQQINLQNIPPQQLAQLVTAMRTAYDQAKNSTNEAERQQHFNRAENIRRLLARYQAQKQVATATTTTAAAAAATHSTTDSTTDSAADSTAKEI